MPTRQYESYLFPLLLEPCERYSCRSRSAVHPGGEKMENSHTFLALVSERGRRAFYPLEPGDPLEINQSGPRLMTVVHSL